MLKMSRDWHTPHDIYEDGKSYGRVDGFLIGVFVGFIIGLILGGITI
jgi:hypothetical protein